MGSFGGSAGTGYTGGPGGPGRIKSTNRTGTGGIENWDR